MSGKSKTSTPNGSPKDCKETNSTTQTCPLADKIKTAGAVQKCSKESCTHPCQNLGMSNQTNVDTFANGMKKLQEDWSKLKPEERIAQMQKFVDMQSKANGFPAPEVVTPNNIASGKNGELRFRDWEVAINPNLASSNQLSPEQAAQLGDTLYHETRHAEQWYLIARKQAGEGNDAKQIQQQLGLPADIANKATKQPLSSTDKAKACADKLHESVYGSKAASRNNTLNNLSKQGKELEVLSKASNNAAETYKNTKSEADLENWKKSYEAYKKAHESFQKTYADYRALPEETDAWDAGGRASEAIKSLFVQKK